VRRVSVSVIAAILAACTGGFVVLQRAAPGGAAANVDRRLTVTVVGNGTVTSSPAGIDCPQTCSALFPSDSTVTLTATAGTGFRFEQWAPLIECRIEPTCDVALTETDRTVSATFRPAATLYVFANGDGAITVSPAGLDLFDGEQVTRCDSVDHPGGCKLAYLPGTRVTATESPAGGRTFAGWSRAGCRGPQCAVRAQGESTLVASFNPLELGIRKSGSGTVTSSPTGIACGDDCRMPAALGTRVVLSATSGPHEWTFGCDPEGGDPRAVRCAVTVSAAPTWVGIRFGNADPPGEPGRITVRLDVRRSGAAAATVRGSKIACGPRCSASYLFGDMEQLTPVDPPGARFRRWENGCGTRRVCRFAVGPTTSITAVFTPPLEASIVRLRASGRGSTRTVTARIKVNQDAAVSLRLRRGGRRIAKKDVRLRTGETPVTIKVPRGAPAGTLGVVVVVTVGNEEKRFTRSIQVGR
jgi:Divergent InlB B-repeat domain